MKQNSAEQPYEAYERLKKELEEVKSSIYELKNIRSYDFKITYSQFLGGLFRKSFKLNKQTYIALIEVLESKKQQIKNELNNLVVHETIK